MNHARTMLAALLTLCAPAWAQVGHWTPATDPGVQVISSTTDGSAWFGMSDRAGVRSTDQGASWVPMPLQITNVFESRGAPGVVVTLSVFGTHYSSDGGLHWVRTGAYPVFDGGSTVGDLAPVGAQPGVIYSTRGFIDGFGSGFVPRNVIRSRDGGVTWQDVGAAAFLDTAPSVAPSPAKAGLVFVGNTTGVYRSRDGGDTWQKVRSAATLPGGNRVITDSVDSRVVYAVTTTDVWVSEDEGDSWRQGAPLHAAPKLRLVADPGVAKRLHVVGNTGEVFETRDAARTWSQHTLRETALGSAGNSSLLIPGPAVAVIAQGSARRLLASGGAPESLDPSYALDVTNPRLVLGPDLWFNPQQPGWGLSLIQHASGQVFAVWFTYDANGRPTWFHIPGGTWTDANTFVADVLQAQGTPYDRTWQPNQFFQHKAGVVTLRFDDRNNGTASFVLQGARFDSPIARMLYGPRPPSDNAWSGIGDLVYNPSESGWGLSLHQQYNTTFGTWFTFDASGQPTWFVMPNGLGDVYRPGARAGVAYSPTGVTVTRVGASSITTLPELRFNFTVDGYSSWSRIEPLPF